MLTGLLGNRTIERILLFLLVNETTYATLLHKQLASSLTPIQKGLERLEKGGILESFYEGKIRHYRFNPAYPLLKELEQLVKGAYILLPPQEKKKYTLIRSTHPNSYKEEQTLLLNVWNRLQTITKVTFTARSSSMSMGRTTGKGKGDLLVTYDGNATLLFHEEGVWVDEKGQEFQFNNLFRWTLNRLEALIGLEHLRRGINHPVFLFHLKQSGPSTLESVHSHLCGDDTYFGHLAYAKETLKLNWRIIGPKKNEEIEYIYTQEE